MIFRGVINRSGAIRDDDIQAYADGVLEGSRRRQVEQHLATHPEDADRVAAYRRINAGLASLGGSAHDAELPAAFLAMAEDLRDALVRQRRVRRTLGGTVASLLVLGSASGAWMLTGMELETAGPGAQLAAVEARASGPVLQDPAEISAASEAEVMTWLSKRVDTERFAAPDLHSAGFTVAGARVRPTPEGPLVQILYHDEAKVPLTLSVSVGNVAHSRAESDELTDRQMAVYWRRGPLVYSLVGPMQRSHLVTLADIVGGQTGAGQSKAVETASASGSASSEKSGVVLVDTNSETSSAAVPAQSAEKSDPPAPAEEAAQKPSVLVEEIEEPKPL